MTVLLHGFWGQPSDWREVLKRLPLTEDVVTPDLFEGGPLAPNHPLGQWTRNFVNWLDANVGPQPVQIIGYSMGARLALSAIVANPQRFSRGLMLSARPVLESAEHAERELWEKTWGRKFLTQPWAELRQNWQEQSVFSGSPPQPRRENELLREWLAASLSNWSARHHEFGWAQIAGLSPDIEFAYGALDQKYLSVAKTLQELPVRGQISFIPNAGHRLPFDAADFIAHWITGRTSYGK